MSLDVFFALYPLLAFYLSFCLFYRLLVFFFFLKKMSFLSFVAFSLHLDLLFALLSTFCPLCSFCMFISVLPFITFVSLILCLRYPFSSSS